jgi:hypothetical protein
MLGLATLLATPLAAQQGDGDEDARAVLSCLDNRTIRRTTVVSARNILFVMRDGRHYNNALPRECPSLNRRSLVNYAVEANRLCAGSQFQVLWQNGSSDYVPAFTCQLGAFLPIDEDEAADLLATSEPRANRREPRRRTGRDAVTSTPVELPKPATTTEPQPEPVREPAGR